MTMSLSFIVSFGLFFAAIASTIVGAETLARVPHCEVRDSSSKIAAAIENKKIVFIGESHTNSPKPITETILFDQLCGLNRPVILLTEFIWPSWQSSLDQFLRDPAFDIKTFLSKHLNPSKLNSKLFEERFTEFLSWVKNVRLPLLGIDLDDFGSGTTYDLPLIPKVTKEKIATQFQVPDYMIDEVNSRDLNMAKQVLRSYRDLQRDELIVVYLGSNHAEKIPSLLAHKIPLAEVLVLHMGEKNGLKGKMREVQKDIPKNESGPRTIYFFPFEEADKSARYAQAVQALIYKTQAYSGLLQ